MTGIIIRVLKMLGTDFFLINSIFLWGVHCTAFRVLVPWTRIELRTSAIRVQSPNHRTAREFPTSPTSLFQIYMYIECISTNVFHLDMERQALLTPNPADFFDSVNKSDVHISWQQVLWLKKRAG